MKLGAVSYLNALPLIRYLDEPVVTAVPSRLAGLLREGALDIALLPVFALFEDKSLRALPEAGLIGSSGAVGSVTLFYKEHLDHPRNASSISFTPDSVTSVALTKIVFNEFFKKDWRTLQQAGPDQADVRLEIGDKALFFSEPGYRACDLGEIWQKETGLPFIYACWIARGDVSREWVKKLAKARDRGLQNRAQIVAENGGDPKLLDYLTKNIQYEMVPQSLAGLELFQSLCRKTGLLS